MYVLILYEVLVKTYVLRQKPEIKTTIKSTKKPFWHIVENKSISIALMITIPMTCLIVLGICFIWIYYYCRFDSKSDKDLDKDSDIDSVKGSVKGSVKDSDNDTIDESRDPTLRSKVQNDDKKSRKDFKTKKNPKTKFREKSQNLSRKTCEKASKKC